MGLDVLLSLSNSWLLAAVLNTTPNASEHGACKSNTGACRSELKPRMGSVPNTCSIRDILYLGQERVLPIIIASILQTRFSGIS